MSEATVTREQLRRLAGFYTIEEMAAIVGIESRQFRYHLECGFILRPSVRIGTKARRYYRRQDVERISETLHTADK